MIDDMLELIRLKKEYEILDGVFLHAIEKKLDARRGYFCFEEGVIWVQHHPSKEKDTCYASTLMVYLKNNGQSIEFPSGSLINCLISESKKICNEDFICLLRLFSKVLEKLFPEWSYKEINT